MLDQVTPPSAPPALPGAPIFAPPPPAALSPLETEIATRHVVNGWLDLLTTVKAPEWRHILFSGKPIRFSIPTPPEASLAALDREHMAMPGDGPAARAKEILTTLQKARPRGAQPRSTVGRRQLPPPRDAMATWLRRVFLLTAGPEALRLLAAAGQLTAGDVTIIEAAYPKGLEKERMESVEAATALGAAHLRSGQEVDLPMWLNSQLLTVMAEQPPAAAFQALYGQPAEEDGTESPQSQAAAGGGGGVNVSAPLNSITKNAAPVLGGTPT